MTDGATSQQGAALTDVADPLRKIQHKLYNEEKHQELVYLDFSLKSAVSHDAPPPCFHMIRH